jgi:hypothetical protein
MKKSHIPGPPQSALSSPREQASMGPRILKDPASVEFAWQTVSWLKGQFHSLTVSEQHWQNALAEAERYRIYDRVPPEQPYGSLDALLKAEIGVSIEESNRIISLRTHGGDRRSAACTGQDQPSVRRLKYGETSAYLTARIARDRPDILEEMKAGKYKSVRAAAKAAGIIKETTPLDLLNRAWAKASADERQQFLRLIACDGGQKAA